MKNALRIGILTGLGIAIYELYAYGFAEADWYKVVFIGAFCMLGIMITSYYTKGNASND